MNQHLNEEEVRVGLAIGDGQFYAELETLDTAWQPGEKLKLLVGPLLLCYYEQDQKIVVDMARPVLLW